METITLQQVVPAAFAGDPDCGKSEVWGREATLRKGEYYLIEAASGRGKSSLCGFLYGCRRDYSGRILFDGADCRAFSADLWGEVRRGSLSLLFQDLRLFGALTLMENLALKNDLTRFMTSARLERLIEAAGLADKRDTPAAKLSFGQQQRAALLRCLCQPFDFILLDEPVSHLDADNGAILSALLLEEAQARGAGVVVTSVGNRLAFPYHKILAL